MKKITVFVLSIVALASAASAQIVTPQNDFTNNCDLYKGKTVIIDGVNLRPKKAATSISVGGPSSVSVGKGTTANVVASCKAIKGFKSIDVNFPSNQNFAACFYMRDAIYGTLPMQQDVIKAQITFKGDKSAGFFIDLYKKQ
jgi:hypothetical protein